MHYEADSQVADVTLKQGVQLLWAQIRLARRFHTIEFVFTLLVSTERGPFKYSCSSAASRPSTSIGLIALAIVSDGKPGSVQQVYERDSNKDFSPGQ